MNEKKKENIHRHSIFVIYCHAHQNKTKREIKENGRARKSDEKSFRQKTKCCTMPKNDASEFPLHHDAVNEYYDAMAKEVYTNKRKRMNKYKKKDGAAM